MNDDEFDIEATLRASLAEHATRSPDGDALAEQIIADADRPRRVHEPRRWRGWALPVVAAGSVAAVVGAVVAIFQLHQPSRHTADHRTIHPSPTVTPTTPAPMRTSGTSSPSSEPSTSSGAMAIPRAFRVTDLTFASADEGWALGSGECFKAPGQRCISIIHTGNGGADWTNVPTPPGASIGTCAQACVQHLRFADDQYGYAYGPTALFMTSDGGRTWHRQGGGADALETLHGNVIRVSDACGGCSPGATYTVRVAAKGSSSWQPVKLPDGPVSGDSVTLSRTGSSAYLLVRQNPAGGAGKAVSTMFASTNDGRTWTRVGEPCSQASGETDSVAMTTALDGSVTVVCVPRGGSASTVATSTDSGRNFTSPRDGSLPLSKVVGAASRDVLFRATDKGLWRSDNGGESWSLVVPGDSQGGVDFLGFEDDRTGRWVPGDGSTIWTTTDAGRNWTPHPFH